jgi:hypothetical protein
MNNQGFPVYLNDGGRLDIGRRAEKTGKEACLFIRGGQRNTLRQNGEEAEKDAAPQAIGKAKTRQ